ncbi:unnamed protein product [Echinostoma caproni]|uniref:Similar to n=1 Tax=Echinostoma caproni TaxID=27848 RepID=A0A183A2H9_9TREM|nr:unnamed protein product [Echinostoma caproni]
MRTWRHSGDKEDEGYAGSSVDGHMAVDEQNALQIVVGLLQDITPGLSSVVTDTLFPHYRRERPTASTDSLATMRLDSQMIPSVKQSLKRFSWKKRGTPLSSFEAPYLSELGPIAVPLCLNIYQTRFGLQYPPNPEQLQNLELTDVPTSKQILINRCGFVQEFLLMHLGIPSRRFIWDSPSDTEETHCNQKQEILFGRFVYAINHLDSLTLGCSESALLNLLERHLHAGAYYRQLTWLTRQTNWSVLGGMWNGNTICSGYTWACLRDAISECLIPYEEGVHLLLERERMAWSNGLYRNTNNQYGPLNLSRKLKLFTDRIE